MSIPRKFKNAEALKAIIVEHLEAVDDGLLDAIVDGQVGQRGHSVKQVDVLTGSGRRERRFTIQVMETTRR
jgi:hypothetical protein